MFLLKRIPEAKQANDQQQHREEEENANPKKRTRRGRVVRFNGM
jgi:hypothetical protein